MDGRGPQRHQDLEDVIDLIAGSYDGGDEINNLESADLPNKRAVIAAFNHIMPVLYMGFYSTRSLNRANLRYALSEHLYPAQDILVEQIDRAVRYQERMGRVQEKKPEGWSEEVVLRERLEQFDHRLVIVRALDQILGGDDVVQLPTDDRGLGGRLWRRRGQDRFDLGT